MGSTSQLGSGQERAVCGEVAPYHAWKWRVLDDGVQPKSGVRLVHVGMLLV